MNYIISASTDVGIKRSINQDCLTVKLIDTCKGNMAFAVLCDGMGGLSEGEVASATLVKAFENWLDCGFPSVCNEYEEIRDSVIRAQWENIIELQNNKIKNYGRQKGIRLGTTITVMLLSNDQYFILNVGDTRAYEITDKCVQITEDHTVVAQEIKMGKLTEENALKDSRQHILLQCVGASETVCPDIFFGNTKKNAVYMLCTDGFRHKITTDEIYNNFRPELLFNSESMKKSENYLININKQRNEQDNISVILIRTF